MTLTAEDHEIRRGKITGSTAAAILGLDPYCTPLGAWLRVTGKAPPIDESTRSVLHRGHVLEPALVAFAADAVARETGAIVAVDKPGTVAHPDLPWAACSIDAVIIGRDAAEQPRAVIELDALELPDPRAALIYGAEAKTVEQGHAWAWGEEWTDQVPAHVAIQCEWELLHYPEAAAIIVPALVGSFLQLRIYVWQHDPDLSAALVHALGAWHARHVVSGEPPPLRAKDAGVLARVWTPNGRALPDDPRVANLVRIDCEARDTIAAAEGRRDAARVGLAELLREHTECRGPWGSVTWRGNRAGGRSMRTHWRGAARTRRSANPSR